LSQSRALPIVVVLFLLFISTFTSSQNFLGSKIISPSQLPSGSGILTAGDINGDGTADVVYTVPDTAGSPGYSSIGIALGSRTGFHVAATYAQRLSRAVLADVNGDGKVDLLGTIGGGPIGPTAMLVIYKGRGDGTFDAPVISQIVTNTNLWPWVASLATGDCDGDGKVDVLVTDSNGNLFFIHGNGDGTTGTPVRFGGKYLNAYEIDHVVDLNRDGKLDLVVTVVNGATIAVRLGNGDGTFQTEQAVGGVYNYSPILADMNGDGIPDIATTTASATGDAFGARIFAGNGDGSFREINSFAVSSVWGTLLAARDLNGDSKIDLVFDNANGFIVCLGDGTGNFGTLTAYTVPRWGSAGAAVGDFDGDGLLDILGGVNYSDPMIYMLRGFGDGQLEGARALDTVAVPVTIASSDLNHDGFIDIIGSTSNGTLTLMGKGDGGFTATLDGVALGDQIFVADMDGDGIKDALYVPSGGYSVGLRRGRNDGTFGDPETGSSQSGSTAAGLGDLNGDGKPDLAGVVFGALYTSFGLGGPNFSAPTPYYIGGSSYDGTKTTIVDVNGDGKNDVVTAIDTTVFVVLGSADGTLTAAGTYAGKDFVITDANGDGKLDLVTISTQSSGRGVDVYPGDGTGTFGNPVHIATSETYSRMTGADLNLDGKTDLILLGGNRVGVMYGNGTGGFGPDLVMPTGEGPHATVIGDWNHDGAPDFAVAESSGASPTPRSIAMFLNRGGSSTALTLSISVAQYGQPVTATAKVTPTVLGSPTPAGNARLSVDGTQFVQGPLANASLSGLIGMAAVGDHTITGSYAGDGKFIGKGFPSAPLTVTKATTTTTVTASANPGVYASKIDFTAHVEPAYAGTATGTLSLWEGSTLLTSGSLANGNVVLSLNDLPQGNHAIFAKYEGDGNFVASNSASITEKVLYATNVSLSSSAPSALVGAAVTFSSDVTSQHGSPTGTVVLREGNVAVGQGSISSGKALVTLTSLASGMHTITAYYQGDDKFIQSGSAAVTQAIMDFSVGANTSTSLTLNAGASGSYGLSVAPMGGFEGTVTISCSGVPALASCAASPSELHVTNGSSASTTITVTTTGPNRAAMPRGNSPFKALSFGLVAVALGGTLGRKKRVALLLCVLTLMGLTMVACGGGGGGGGNPSTPAASVTPSGTTTLLVTARVTSGNVTVTHDIPLTLTIR
jgi:Bacterial Ig-like domain (group 3)/FG-GAP-like repeat